MGKLYLVVAGASSAAAIWDKGQVEVAVAKALAVGYSSKRVAQEVAAQSGWSKKEVYTLAL